MVGDIFLRRMANSNMIAELGTQETATAKFASTFMISL